MQSELLNLVNVIYLIQSVLAVGLIQIIYRFLFCFERRKSDIGFILLSVVSVLCSVTLPFVIKDVETADEINELILFFIFVFLPNSAFRHRKKILVPLLGLMINATIDYFVFMITSSLGIASFAVIGAMYSVIYAMLIVFVMIKRKKISRDSVNTIFDSISPVFYLVILAADFSAYYDVILDTDASSYVEVSNAVRLISTVFLVFGIAYIVSKYTASLHKQKESEMQVDMQMKLYSEMMKKNRAIREFRHDYKNNLFSLETFIENEKYDDAKKYIEDLNGSLEKTKNRYATGNYLADAIISDKADCAGEFNTEIDFKGTIPENGISNSDLCTVLSNALDNAVRACRLVAPCKINVESKESSKGVIIKIKNPVKQRVEIKNNRIKTTKADKENHGIGLDNIRKTAAKYAGYVELSCDDSFFEIEIGLYFNSQEGQK